MSRRTIDDDVRQQHAVAHVADRDVDESCGSSARFTSKSHRFLVASGGGSSQTMAVRGTAFDVEVHGDHFVRVEVDHGRVEVRTPGGTRSDKAVVQSPPSRPVVALRPAHVTSNVIAIDHANPALIVAAVRESEREFRAGWDALNAGEPRRAAVAFARAVAVDPGGAMAEDSAYWRAVALSRARDVSARGAFASFLAQFPRATHAKVHRGSPSGDTPCALR